jgi:hypothetical protein
VAGAEVHMDIGNVWFLLNIDLHVVNVLVSVLYRWYEPARRSGIIFPGNWNVPSLEKMEEAYDSCSLTRCLLVCLLVVCLQTLNHEFPTASLKIQASSAFKRNSGLRLSKSILFPFRSHRRNLNFIEFETGLKRRVDEKN